MRFRSNFECKIIFMCSVNFWYQQDWSRDLLVQVAYWLFARKQLLELDLTKASKTNPYVQFSVLSNDSVR